MPQFILREISPDDSVSGLSLGDEAFVSLKTFLSKYAKHYHRCNVAKTYVFVSDDKPLKVIGYITLVCSHLEVQTPDDVGEYAYPDFPAIKIARLAVDRRFRGNDLATKLVDYALAIASDHVIPHVGCRFLVVDAKRQSVGFYEKSGFRMLNTDDNKAASHPVMFIDVGKLD